MWHAVAASGSLYIIIYIYSIKRDISRDKITLKTRLTEYVFRSMHIRLRSKKLSSFIIIYRFYIGCFYSFSDNVRFRGAELPNLHTHKRNVSRPAIYYNITH